MGEADGVWDGSYLSKRPEPLEASPGAAPEVARPATSDVIRVEGYRLTEAERRASARYLSLHSRKPLVGAIVLAAAMTGVALLFPDRAVALGAAVLGFVGGGIYTILQERSKIRKHNQGDSEPCTTAFDETGLSVNPQGSDLVRVAWSAVTRVRENSGLIFFRAPRTCVVVPRRVLRGNIRALAGLIAAHVKDGRIREA